MGLAYGRLMKDELIWQVDNFYPYIASEIEGYVKFWDKIPTFIQKLGTSAIIGVIRILLDLNYEICNQYIP